MNDAEKEKFLNEIKQILLNAFGNMPGQLINTSSNPKEPGTLRKAILLMDIAKTINSLKMVG